MHKVISDYLKLNLSTVTLYTFVLVARIYRIIGYIVYKTVIKFSSIKILSRIALENGFWTRTYSTISNTVIIGKKVNIRAVTVVNLDFAVLNIFTALLAKLTSQLGWTFKYLLN